MCRRISTPPLLGLGLVALWIGCAEQPPPRAIPVEARPGDLFVLEGEWSGQYWSVDTGRSGRIRLSLRAEEDHAFGDVLMLSSPHHEELLPADREPSATAETLAISFIRIDATSETVSGTLEPYRDPDCDCIVATTFTGVASRDAIEGTFVTQAGGAYGTRRGRWKVERRAPE